MSSKKIHIFLILIVIIQKIYSIPSQTADYVSKSQLSHKLGGGYAVTKQLSNVGFTSEIYDATSGLPTSDANFILGSKDGYVWICGYSGVIRYDGTTFERLPTNTGLTSGRALFEDSKNRIWVGTNDNGVVVINGEKSQHYTYKDGLPSSSIRSFSEDGFGNIFIGTTSGLAYVNEQGLLYRLSNEKLNSERVLKLDADSSRTVYGQTSSGIVFSIKDWKIEHIYTSQELGLDRITTILADRKIPGHVYLCCADGSIYYGKFGSKKEGLAKFDVSPIKIVHWISWDCDRIWLSSTNQIGYLDQNNKFNLVSNLPMNSAVEMTTSDYQGNIWACSATQGVMKIVTNNFVNLTREGNLSKETVNATCLHQDSLYIGTDRGLQILDKNRKPVQNELTKYIGNTRIRCIIEDDDDNLWIAGYTNNMGLVCLTAAGKIKALTTKDGLLSNEIRSLSLAKDKSLIAGTNGGLAIIKNGKVIRTVGSKEGIRNTVFLTVEEDKDGKIYAGSDGDGIYVINGSEITHLTREDGLTSDVIMRIKYDEKRDMLWLVTSNSIQFIKYGIIKNVSSFPYNNNYDLYYNSNDDEFWILSSYGIYTVKVDYLVRNSVKEFRHYTIANGLPCSITSNSYSALDDKGNLYISGREGVVLVNINHFFDQSAQVKVTLNSIYSGDNKINPSKDGSYIIPSSNSRIKLTASVLDYTMTNPIVRVFLEGSNDDGIMVPRNELSSLEYTGLSYGNYTFHIQLWDHNRKEILLDKSFDIIKKPRITELYLFRAIILALIILLAGFIVWRFMKSTVITRQYEQIRQSKADAERASTAKSRFLSNMSQEILTPINTILGMDEMILRENAKDVPKGYFLSVMNYALNIRNASESLFNLINDLLEMTKIESGKLQLSEQEYDLQDLLRSIINPIRIKSNEKDLKFTLNIDPLLPKRLYGDVGKIKQIVMKLLSNALKYTEEGGFEFTISMESRIDNVCDLCIRVKDSGMGIKAEDVESLFDAYGGLIDGKAPHLQTGLGLDISRKFAELMGGVLICQSDIGKGSEFIFTLQQKIIDATAIGSFAEQEDLPARGPYLPQFIAPDADVLVIDQNPINLHVISSLLKATKVFVTTAQSVQSGIDKIRESTFNIVFIDYLLFEGDEEKIDETIKTINHFAPKLPVYIFTENAINNEDFYKSKGYTGTISIPVDCTLLERTIMRYIPKEMMEIPDSSTYIEDLKEIPEELTWVKSTEGLSVDDGIKNSGGIGNFLFALKLFTDTIDENLRNIEDAYKKGDFKLFRIKNGIIKTSAKIVGAKALFELTSKFEEAFKKNDRIFISANTDKLISEYKAFKEKLQKLKNKDDTGNV
ncbi:MAG: hybrid sensor histidine kinase/response regulator [Treponema sp.]|nr:hybrid sensor histidine kinase/response regulator [Treponema sp.]